MVYKLCIPCHLLGPVCSASSSCGYLINTYVLRVTLIFVSLMTGMYVRAWTVYHSCVCLCYSLIRVSCLSMSPFVPFQSSIMNRLLRVRPSQKLLYEHLPVQTKIINGMSRECHNKIPQPIPRTKRKTNLQTETTKLHVNNACVHGSTNGTNGRPISFKVLPMIPLVIPLVPMVPLVKTDGSQYCRQSTVWAKLPTLESHMIKYGVLNFKFINFTNKHCFYQDDIRK